MMAFQFLTYDTVLANFQTREEFQSTVTKFALIYYSMNFIPSQTIDTFSLKCHRLTPQTFIYKLK